MNADWEDLDTVVIRLKSVAAVLRKKCGELNSAEVERLLVPLRGCMVELIALRSSLERLKIHEANEKDVQAPLK